MILAYGKSDATLFFSPALYLKNPFFRYAKVDLGVSTACGQRSSPCMTPATSIPSWVVAPGCPGSHNRGGCIGVGFVLRKKQGTNIKR